MKITIQRIDPNNEEQLQAMCNWWNDSELIELTTPKNERFVHVTETASALKSDFKKNPEKVNQFYIISCDERYAGYYSILIDPPHRLNKEKKTGWLGLTIGERDLWGTGVALAAMKAL